MPSGRAGLLLSLMLAASAGAGTTILVGARPFESVEAAAHGEAKVDWLDADAADETACTICFAAIELQRCLRAMTGREADFPLAALEAAKTPPAGDLLLIAAPIHLKNSIAKDLCTSVGLDATGIPKLGPQGYRIKSAAADGRRITCVVGGGRAGALYGVYDLLHRLGARWFAPGELHEELARIDQIPDLDVTARPDFLTRGFHAWEDRGNPEFLLWMARNRMNYWCVQQSGHPLVRKLCIQMSCGSHDAQPKFLNPYQAYPYNHAQFDGDQKRPADPYPLSPQFAGDADRDGKLTTFEAHPEWFAQVKGKRVPGYKGAFGTNYCTSNPHATTEFFKNYIHALAAGPYRDAQVVRFWTLDGGRWCECDACKALGSPTDRNLLLVHRLATEIAKARADGRINRPITVRFLAYADVLQPPTRPLPADFDYATCCATFFPIVRCYVHNIDDPKCPRNARYRRQLHGWAADPKRHYRGSLCIGEYYNVSGYKCLPICYMHTMANDIPFYHRTGARHFHYMHATTGKWGSKALTNTQMARQLWDAGTDCEALWADYFARRYGPAADTMARFYGWLEKMLCNVTELKYVLPGRLDRGAAKLFTGSHLRMRREEGVVADGPTLEEIVSYAAECRKCLSRALAADIPQRFLDRIAEDERGFTYGERTVLYYWECAQAFELGRAGKKDAARPHFAEARRLADQLRDDTVSTTLSSSHANERNAFTASRATGALAHLSELLGPADPAAIRAFDPAAQPLVLTGRDFAGGGALRFGHGLSVFPGRKKVSDAGNNVYAKPTGAYSRMTARFRLGAVPGEPLVLAFVGLSRPVTDAGQVPAEILVNGKVVYSGPAPFSIKGLSRRELTVPAAALVEGENQITVRNVAGEGPVGNRPWFGIDRVEIRLAKTPRTP